MGPARMGRTERARSDRPAGAGGPDAAGGRAPGLSVPAAPLSPPARACRMNWYSRSAVATLEDQVAGGLEREAVESRRHRPITASPAFCRSTTPAMRRNASITCFARWRCRGAASWRCAGLEMPQRRAVLHQPDIMDVRHLRKPTPGSIQRTT